MDEYLKVAIDQVKAGLKEGGIPIYKGTFPKVTPSSIKLDASLYNIDG